MEITEQKHSDINTKLIFISFVILGQTSKLQFFLGGVTQRLYWGKGWEKSCNCNFLKFQNYSIYSV